MQRGFKLAQPNRAGKEESGVGTGHFTPLWMSERGSAPSKEDLPLYSERWIWYSSISCNEHVLAFAEHMRANLITLTHTSPALSIPPGLQRTLVEDGCLGGIGYNPDRSNETTRPASAGKGHPRGWNVSSSKLLLFFSRAPGLVDFQDDAERDLSVVGSRNVVPLSAASCAAAAGFSVDRQLAVACA